VEVVRYAAGGNEYAERVPGAGDEAGNGPCFGSFEDVGEFGEPFVLVDGGELAEGEAPGSKAEDGVRQMLESGRAFLR